MTPIDPAPFAVQPTCDAAPPDQPEMAAAADRHESGAVALAALLLAHVRLWRDNAQKGQDLASNRFNANYEAGKLEMASNVLDLLAPYAERAEALIAKKKVDRPKE